MPVLSWGASLAGAALIITTGYAAAQMGSMPQSQMSPERMMGMMKQMSQMMDHCHRMMRGGEHGGALPTPEKNEERLAARARAIHAAVNLAASSGE